MRHCRCNCHRRHRRRRVCTTCFTRGRIYEHDGEYRFAAFTRCISRRCRRHICRHHNEHVRDGLLNFTNDNLINEKETEALE